MPASFTPKRFPLVWAGAGLLLMISVGLAVRGVVARKNARISPVAAYLVPVEANTRLGLGWWRMKDLPVPEGIASGRKVLLTEGTRIKIIHPDTGAIETISGPTRLQFQPPAPDEPRMLISPLTELLPRLEALLKLHRADFVITSPVGVTRYLNPAITWTAKEGVRYDVAVLDPADPLIPPRIAEKVRPPVSVVEMKTPQRRELLADRIYDVAIRVADAPEFSGTARVLAAPEADLQTPLPTTPADLLIEAFSAMAKKPTRTGDAWLALTHLPADWASSEPAVRLRLQVAAELGLADEFEKARSDAGAFLKR